MRTFRIIASVLLLGLTTVAVSSAQTWEKVFDTDVSIFEFETLVTGTMLAGDQRGEIFRSVDDGLTWHETLKIPESGVYEVVDIVSHTPDEVYAILESGLYRSADDGVTWYRIPARSAASMSVTSSGTILIGGHTDTIFRSTDQGETWTEVASYGVNWTHMGGWHVSNEVNGTVQAGISGCQEISCGQILRSTDDGVSWSVLVNGTIVHGFSIQDLVLDPSGSAYALQGLSASFLISPDAWATWRFSFFGHFQGTTYFVLPVTPNTFFGGSGSGLFISRDSGYTWEYLGIDQAQGLGISSKGDLVVSNIRGVFRSSEPITINREAGMELPEGLSISSIHPNPFSANAVVRFSTSVSGNVHVSVFDMLGRFISTPFDGYKMAGSHKIELDGNQLSAGIYAVVIESESGRSTKLVTRVGSEK